MILIDAGPLVALVDADDQYHEKCVDCLKSLREPLVTVWPPLVEAVYLLRDLPQAQEALWEMLARGAVRLLSLDLVDIPRVRELMIKYADRPMALADAALVRVAESRRHPEDLHGGPRTISRSIVFTEGSASQSSPRRTRNTRHVSLGRSAEVTGSNAR